MAEVGFFPKYEQKENRVTNYTLLVLLMFHGGIMINAIKTKLFKKLQIF